MSVVFVDESESSSWAGIDPWMGLTHTLFGANGQVLDLSDPDKGFVLINAEVVGLGSPAYDVYRTPAPALAGSRYRGHRAQERSVEMAVVVHDDRSTDGFLAKDRWLWDLIGDPGEPVVWRVATPSGDWRELSMRFAEDASGGFPRDPLWEGWTLYQLRFVADDPYWHGPEIVRTFTTSPAGPFFPEPPDTHLLYISQALTTDAVQVTNPGDVQAWVTWTATGALTNLDLVMSAEGVTDGALGLPDVATGSELVANTDPRVATARLDGLDITDQVNPWDPRPIPSRGTQTLAVGIAGTGVLRAAFRPRYRRAW